MVATFFGSAGRAVAPAAPASSNSPRASRERVVIESLSATQWRVCDTRWPEHDARSVLGFIEKKEDLFEVMQLTDGFEWLSFASLSAIKAHFTRAQSNAPADSETVLSRLRAQA